MTQLLKNYGKIISIKDGIIIVKGLNKITSGELVKFSNDTNGMALLSSLR